MQKGIHFDGRPVWAEIRLGALAHNLRAIRKHLRAETRSSGPRRKPPSILAVVKGNGYGHGAVPVAQELSRAGADWFGVTSTAEGMELREAGIREPILVLTGYGREQDCNPDFRASDVNRAIEIVLARAGPPSARRELL